MKFLLRILITAAVAYGLSKVLSGIHIDTFVTAIIFALVLSFLNSIVKPILVILTLPLTVLTLGLFLLIINVIIILLAGKFVDGIKIDGFFWALIFGFLLSFISSILIKMDKSRRDN
jgi:putative membrane protein